MQIMHFILDKILTTFDVIHAFPSLFVAKLSDLKNSPVFWPTLYIYILTRTPDPNRPTYDSKEGEVVVQGL